MITATADTEANMAARSSNDASASSTPQNTDIDDNLRLVGLDDNNKGNDSSDTDHDGRRSTVVIPTTSELEVLATTRTSLTNKSIDPWWTDYHKSLIEEGHYADSCELIISRYSNVCKCSRRDVYMGRVAGAGRYDYKTAYDHSEDEMETESGEIKESVNKGDGGYRNENMMEQEQEDAGRIESG